MKIEKYKRRAVELLSNLLLEYKPRPSVIPYVPQKTKICGYEKRLIKRCRPENVGMDSDILSEMLLRLEEETRANVHSILVLKDSKVICEASRPGYSPRCPHLSHSMSKSVIGLTIGMLFDDGKIDTDAPITDFFRKSDEYFKGIERVRIEDLLTMKSGISFFEIGSVTETDWTRAALECESDFPAGEKFSYNSMNSYLLAVIAERIIRESYGISLGEYLNTRLFSPLGIKSAFWEIGPEGVEKGGWGLYLSLEGWARIGITVLGGGVYQGRRIISERWLKMSTSTHSVVPREAGDFNYGYQMWVGREKDEILFNGMLGQNVWIYRPDGIVAALSSGNNELFGNSPALNIIREYLSKKQHGAAYHRSDGNITPLREREKSFFHSRCFITPKRQKTTPLSLLGLKSAAPFPDVYGRILGKYDFSENNQGILPFFVRLMQNNYQGGIESFTLKKKGEILTLISREGGVDYAIDFGFYSPAMTVLEPCGEKYLVLGIADTAEDGLGRLIYRMELIFPELPNTRRIFLTLSEEYFLSVKMTEIPDEKFADDFIRSLPVMNTRIGMLIELFERNLGKNFIKTKLTEAFSPTLFAVRTDSPHYEDALGEENRKAQEKIASSRLVRSLITRFIFAPEDEEKGKKSDTPDSIGEKSQAHKLLKRILSRFLC